MSSFDRVTYFDELPDRLAPSVVTVGNFDGVHRGHAQIVRRLIAVAEQLGLAAVVFTFEPHPAVLLHPGKAPPPLTDTRQKAALLYRLGVNTVIAYRTSRALLDLDPRDFFEQILCHRLHARAIVEGSNFLFGRNRSGNAELLRQWCAERSMAIEIVEPIEHQGQAVSSSRIRAMVSAGMIEQANQLLGRPYRLSGQVVHGAGRGTRLGYPTANLGGIGTLLPEEGIYAGCSQVEGRSFPAALAIGPNCTFEETEVKVEVHLSGFQGQLHGATLDVDLLRRLRPVRKFATVEQLIEQMRRDVAATQRVVASYGELAGESHSEEQGDHDRNPQVGSHPSDHREPADPPCADEGP